MCKLDCVCGECKSITAYKDNHGVLHLTATECANYNKNYRKAEIESQARGIFRKSFQDYFGKGYNPYDHNYYRYDMSNDTASDLLTSNWRRIRDELNLIKD